MQRLGPTATYVFLLESFFPLRFLWGMVLKGHHREATVVVLFFRRFFFWVGGLGGLARMGDPQRSLNFNYSFPPVFLFSFDFILFFSRVGGEMLLLF